MICWEEYRQQRSTSMFRAGPACIEVPDALRRVMSEDEIRHVVGRLVAGCLPAGSARRAQVDDDDGGVIGGGDSATREESEERKRRIIEWVMHVFDGPRFPCRSFLEKSTMQHVDADVRRRLVEIVREADDETNLDAALSGIDVYGDGTPLCQHVANDIPVFVRNEVIRCAEKMLARGAAPRFVADTLLSWGAAVAAAAAAGRR